MHCTGEMLVCGTKIKVGGTKPKKAATCTALPPSRHPTGSILKADVVNPHLQIKRPGIKHTNQSR